MPRSAGRATVLTNRTRGRAGGGGHTGEGAGGSAAWRPLGGAQLVIRAAMSSRPQVERFACSRLSASEPANGSQHCAILGRRGVAPLPIEELKEGLISRFR